MELLHKIRDFTERISRNVVVSKRYLNDRGIIDSKQSCPSCNRHVNERELDNNLFVCPFCGHHFRMTVRERIASLADQGSFSELFADIEARNPIDFPDYEDKIHEAKEKTLLKEAVVCGLCSIHDKPIILSVMAFQFMGGSMGSVVGEKVTRAIEYGARERLPVVIVTSSGGARMQEGIYSLMQMAKTSAAIARLEEARVPLFIVLSDPTTGGVTASFAMLGTVILAEPEALIGFAGPRVIEGTIKQKLPEGFQRSEFLLEKGFVDCVVERKDLKKTLAFLIDAYPISQRGKR